jgi:hypothetical protein
MTEFMTSAETRSARGHKRTCQNDDCGCRFYDLGRKEIACPICGAAFHPPVAAVATGGYNKRRRPAWGAMAAVAHSAEVPAAADSVALEKSEDGPADAPDLDSAGDVVLEDIDDDEPPALEDVAIEE